MVIYNPSEDGYIKEIDFNFDELKTALNGKLEEYRGLVYTDDSIKLAKDDRAALNKLNKSIDAKRKAVKNKCMEPYTKFEEKIKELQELIKEPIAEIDTQIKDFEERKREEKQAKIEAYYSRAVTLYTVDGVNGIPNIMPLTKIQKPQWANTSYSMKSIEAEIDNEVARIKQEVDVIKNLGTEFEGELIVEYRKNPSLAETMIYKSKLEEMKRRVEERKRKEEEERKQREERELEEKKQREIEKQRQIEEERQAQIEIEIQKEKQAQVEAEKQFLEALETVEDDILFTQPEPEPIIEPEPELEELRLTLLVTPEQKKALRTFIINNGIKWVK